MSSGNVVCHVRTRSGKSKALRVDVLQGSDQGEGEGGLVAFFLLAKDCAFAK